MSKEYFIKPADALKFIEEAYNKTYAPDNTGDIPLDELQNVLIAFFDGFYESNKHSLVNSSKDQVKYCLDAIKNYRKLAHAGHIMGRVAIESSLSATTHIERALKSIEA